ncbi:MAG: hypothetical protein ACOC5T_06215 [Elusimicrobiota bacterium]
MSNEDWFDWKIGVIIAMGVLIIEHYYHIPEDILTSVMGVLAIVIMILIIGFLLQIVIDIFKKRWKK